MEVVVSASGLSSTVSQLSNRTAVSHDEFSLFQRQRIFDLRFFFSLRPFPMRFLSCSLRSFPMKLFTTTEFRLSRLFSLTIISQRDLSVSIIEKKARNEKKKKNWSERNEWVELRRLSGSLEFSIRRSLSLSLWLLETLQRFLSVARRKKNANHLASRSFADRRNVRGRTLPKNLGRILRVYQTFRLGSSHNKSLRTIVFFFFFQYSYDSSLGTRSSPFVRALVRFLVVSCSGSSIRVRRVLSFPSKRLSRDPVLSLLYLPAFFPYSFRNLSIYI